MGGPSLATRAAAERQARQRCGDILLDRLSPDLATGVATEAQPVAPGGWALVTRRATHGAQALLGPAGQRKHARDRDELLEAAVEPAEALPTPVTQPARHQRRHAPRDRAQLITEHRMIRRRANHLTSRVIARLDQPRQIDRPPQPRQLILVRHRNAERNNPSQLSYRHSQPLPVGPRRSPARVNTRAPRPRAAPRARLHIHLRAGDLAMPEQLLDQDQPRAGSLKLARETVTQPVRSDHLV
jgi:hypothetical protein